jgi:hypothetical protein
MKFKVQSAPSQTKLFGGLIIAASLMFSQSAWAAGTPSNTTIANQATLGYSVSGVAQTAILSDGDTVTAGVQTTDFKVDNKINLTVVTVDAAAVTVVPGQTTAVTPIVATFTVTNNGNTVQDYSLAAANLSSIAANNVFPFAGPVNDTFDTGACSTFVESGATLGFQAAQDTATFIDELAIDTTKTVYVVCASIPGTQVNGDQANVSLTATTLAGGAAGIGAAVSQAAANTQAGVEIVFADPTTAVNVSGTDPGQTARDAIGVARDAFKVVSASLAVTKTVTPICDPFNGNVGQKNIPGAAVQYAITIVNTGGAAATLTTLSDTLQLAGVNGIVFDPKLNSGALPATNCVSGNAANTLSASGFGAVSAAGAVTTYAAPGLAAQAVTAGATVAGQVVSVNFATLAGGTGLVGWTGSLAAGSFITVYFNAFVQ